MTVEFTIPNDLVGLLPVLDMIEESLQDSAYTEHEIFAIKLAVEEALVNAITHGNLLAPDKHVQVCFTVTAERFDIRITDEGDGFDPGDNTPDPTSPHILECPPGRGLLLMHTFMTEVEYHGRGNTVRMAKVRESSTS